MCEIQIMIKTNNKFITKLELKNFLFKAVKSANDNPHGYGVMCEKWFSKKPEKMNNLDVLELVKLYNEDSRFFALHTRWATCEIKEDYTHPFVFDTFMGMHNGVVSTDIKEINTGSDSLDLFKTIDKQRYNTLKQRIIKGMLNISGSYSVLIYAINEKSIYYYRNGLSFGFLLNEKDSIIYGGTKIDRLNSLLPKKYGFFEYGLQKDPEKNILYKIDLKDGVFIKDGYVLEKPEIETPIIETKTKTAYKYNKHDFKYLSTKHHKDYKKDWY